MSYMEELEYATVLHEYQYRDENGFFGIKILVTGTKLPNLKTEDIEDAARDSVARITGEIRAAAMAEDEKHQAYAKEEREKLLALFDGVIFVEVIPNGSSDAYYVRHRPWFVVTTKIGHFMIGWRKSVIYLDWSKTVCKQDAKTLFPDEGVTKNGRSIHCWTYEKAREYIGVIMSTAAAG